MTRGNFFTAITGAIAAAIPGKSETLFQECAACAAKPGSPVLCVDCLRRRDGSPKAAPKVAVEEFSVKGKLMVLKTPMNLSESQKENVRTSIQPLLDELGFKIMELSDPLQASDEAMVERIASRIAEKMKPSDEVQVRRNGGLLCKCGFEMICVSDWPNPRRTFECRHEHCDRNRIQVLEPLHSTKLA